MYELNFECQIDKKTVMTSSNKIDLLVVIINYNTSELTFNSVKSVLPQLTGSMMIAVVDNASSKSSREKLKNSLGELQDSRVFYIQSASNRGFSAGNNLGIKSRRADFYLLLNSDTIVRNGALLSLYEAAQMSEPDVGILSPRLECLDGTPQISCFNFHSPLSEFLDQARLKLFNKILNRWNVPLSTVENISFPQWTSFACVLIKKEVFDRVGLLDESFFLYYEDVDYCFQSRRKGWRVKNIPLARVVHLRGGSSSTKQKKIMNMRLPAYVYESRSRYYAKNYGARLGLLFANIMWYLGRMIAVIKLLFRRPYQPAVERQFIDIWKNFKTPLKGSR
jgi:N-acetylglucosaminyl-diphospho-decaprenol L-rhamnosyltransferase